MTGLKSGELDLPGWSWLVSALGLALVTGTAGFMLYQSFAGDSSPPDMVISADSVIATASGYLVPIQVLNRGGSPAAGLTVEGVLRQGTTAVETSSVTIDYVPSGSRRTAGLGFSRDPRGLDLQLRTKGYENP